MECIFDSNLKAKTHVLDQFQKVSLDFLSKWEPINYEPEDANGNLGYQVKCNKSTGRASYVSRFSLEGLEEETVYTFKFMSTQLALYRTLCMFRCSSVLSFGPHADKLVYSVYFKHYKYPFFLGIREWKGSFTVSSATEMFPKKSRSSHS